MASLTIRQLDDSVRDRLRRRAAARGVSMEEEARRALQNWVTIGEQEGGLGTRIRRRFAGLGLELDLPPRTVEDRALPDIFNEE